MTAPISPIGGTTNPSAGHPTARLGDKDMFLKLLIAQLRHQNPLQPTDPSTLLSQSAQYTMVERLTAISTILEQRLEIDEIALGFSLVGRQVTYERDGYVEVGIVEAARIDRSRGPVVRMTDSTEIPLDAVAEVRMETT
jgi:flagellar basal-body rod modification protein FlgD